MFIYDHKEKQWKQNQKCWYNHPLPIHKYKSIIEEDIKKYDEITRLKFMYEQELGMKKQRERKGRKEKPHLKETEFIVACTKCARLKQQ